MTPWRSPLVFAALVGLLAAFAPAAAKDKTAPAAKQEVTLPEPLTKESIRELMSRLSDDEVRALLIKQLDRAAAPSPAKQADDMGAMAHTMGGELARIRERAAAVYASAGSFPDELQQIAVRIADPFPPNLLWAVAGWFLVMLAVGAAAELAVRFSTSAALRRYEDQTATSLAASSVRFAHRAGIGLARLAAFAAASVATFFFLWQGHEAVRFVVLVTLAAIVQVRVVTLLAMLLLEPGAPRLRLLPFDDHAARVLYWGLARLAALYAFLMVLQVFFTHFSATEESKILLAMVIALLFVLLMLDTVWKVREDVARLIRGAGESSHLRRLLADIWPGLAALYLFALLVSRYYSALLGDSQPSAAPIASVMLALALPLVDMLLCRIVAAAVLSRAHGAAAIPGGTSEMAEGFEPVLRRAIHIIVLVAGLLILADLWGVDPFAMAEHSLGGRITSAIFGIAVTTLLAWILWEAARTAIDRRMNAETATGKPVSRLRTLLPLLRVTLQITILVIAVLSILAALGINIVPLLAGASVVGLAVGFGSQTLVRDIVSGAFFLMDDAFRLGEYIEVGDAKGTVEKIGLRSVILRHHRGALNVLPYGEIKRLRNTSRDWMILVMEFRLAHDTDLAKVKKIMKKIGQELAADPDFGPDILEPLKSQGVLSTDDTSLVVRAKFMAKARGRRRLHDAARSLRAAAEGLCRAGHQVRHPPGHGQHAGRQFGRANRGRGRGRCSHGGGKSLVLAGADPGMNAGAPMSSGKPEAQSSPRAQSIRLRVHARRREKECKHRQ